MSLKHALLGFLNYQSMTGYQLKKYFDESVSNFWNASLSQIYPTLSHMCEDGLVIVEEVEFGSSLNKKKYNITSNGKEELLKWLTEPTEIEPLRSGFLVKLYFSSNTSKEAVIIQLQNLMELSKKKLHNYEKDIEHLKEDHVLKDEMKHESLFWKLTANYGIKHEEMRIEWCNECIKEIREYM